MAYNDVAHFVHNQYGSRAISNRVDTIRNLLFEKLLGMAALYTDEGNPLCFNRRPSYQSRLLQRVNVQARVQTLKQNFDLTALTPAVVIFDPQDEETLRRVRDQWQSGNPHPLLEAVETFDKRFFTRPQFFTVVGNHSSQAHVQRW